VPVSNVLRPSAGLVSVVAILLSKIGHALGVRLETAMVKTWGGLPTERWLDPTDPDHSEQMKSQWRVAVSSVSGVDLELAARSTDPGELRRAIRDAVAACRGAMRRHEKAQMLTAKNIEYGFARNLAGLRWLALVIAAACFGGSLYGALHLGLPAGGTVLLAAFVVVAAFYCHLATDYVEHCADRYAEFFFAAVLEIAKDLK
jgi:hypothetical protein